jgi:hypothetical protein
MVWQKNESREWRFRRASQQEHVEISTTIMKINDLEMDDSRSGASQFMATLAA